MLLSLSHVAIYTRTQIPEKIIDSMIRLFQRSGIECHLAQDGDGSFDLVIALGGDGTVLHALKTWPEAPVLAVNFGHVGFLSQCDEDALNHILVRLLADDYSIEERLALDVTLKHETWRCINEVVIRSPKGRMISVDLAVDGQVVRTPRGDGIIVGTPTGSTAYLMSTGAPLCTPKVDCLILQPLNEHSLSSRTLIVPGSCEITLTPWRDHHQKGSEVFSLGIDGETHHQHRAGDAITIRRSLQPARLVVFESDYFFTNLRKRLNW